MELYTLHLFAGSGGGILADLLLGHRIIGAVEIDAYARQVLLCRQADGTLPQFPVWDDVRTFRADNPDTAEYIKRLRGIRENLCISGGFPCQDISAAGKGEGINGERSGLWKEFARIVREIRPQYVFLENSNLLVRRGLDVVLTDLAEMRYSLAWGIISAADVGAPHLRKRFWAVGSTHTQLMPTPTAHESKGSVTEKTMKRNSLDLTNYVAVYPTPGTTGLSNGSGNCKRILKMPHLTDEEKRSMRAGNGGKLNPDWVEWLMGFPIGWTKISTELSGRQMKKVCRESRKRQRTEQTD